MTQSTTTTLDQRRFRRSPPLLFPLVISLLFAGFTIMLLLAGEASLIALIMIIGLPIMVLAWTGALRERGLFIEVSAEGVSIEGQYVRWRDVANVRLTHERNASSPYLTLQLAQPLPAASWAGRVNAFLSRGKSNREISVSLRYADAPAKVIHDLVRELWQRVVGDEISLAAWGKEVAQYERELSRFSDLPAEEKRRIFVGVALPFLILGACAYGIFADFLVSPSWARLSGWVAAACTAFGLFVVLRKRGFASIRNNSSTTAHLLAFAFAFLLLTGCCWIVVGRSLPDLGTRLLGRVQQSTPNLRVVIDDNARKCTRRVTGG
ncbi:MAG TPA: hypothetical protein VGO61_00930 [Steroidobacteraceae bacterium]|jgi:hypothetical protein|nr:hypothetical protein [Steroidobacteraceae bacterium]